MILIQNLYKVLPHHQPIQKYFSKVFFTIDCPQPIEWNLHFRVHIRRQPFGIFEVQGRGGRRRWTFWWLTIKHLLVCMLFCSACADIKFCLCAVMINYSSFLKAFYQPASSPKHKCWPPNEGKYRSTCLLCLEFEMMNLSNCSFSHWDTLPILI